MIFYALLDGLAGTLTGEYPTEAEALVAIFRTVQEQGPEALVGYAMLRDDGNQDPVLIAADAELATLANQGPARHLLLATLDDSPCPRCQKCR